MFSLFLTFFGFIILLYLFLFKMFCWRYFCRKLLLIQLFCPSYFDKCIFVLVNLTCNRYNLLPYSNSLLLAENLSGSGEVVRAYLKCQKNISYQSTYNETLSERVVRESWAISRRWNHETVPWNHLCQRKPPWMAYKINM